jgi:hypothetical protein
VYFKISSGAVVRPLTASLSSTENVSQNQIEVCISLIFISYRRDLN